MLVANLLAQNSFAQQVAQQVEGADSRLTPTAQEQLPEGPSTAIAFGGKLLGDEKSVRLMIDLDRKVNIQPFYMNNPPRLVIDMSKTAFRFDNKDQIKPRGLVTDLRYGTMARGSSRIVITLNSPIKIMSQELIPLAKSRFRLTLDLAKSDSSVFEAQIARQRNTIGTSGNTATKGDRLRADKNHTGRLVIVLDPGHGGIDGGANGANGTVEKDITLAVAQRIERALNATGFFDVFMTRRGDHFISLSERVKFTIRKQADLFVSIHADTLRQKDVRGATVYTLSRKASDELSKKLAESENRADLIAGLAKTEIKDEVVNILADLAARETKKFSVRFARIVVRTFQDEITLIKNPHRQADFGVLKDPNVPSILLELGYLSNAEDEKLLQSNIWRANLARHLVSAIKLFFADRIPK